MISTIDTCPQKEWKIVHYGEPRPKPKFKICDVTPNNFWLPDKMASGLQNAGNTCFLNSVVQCLQHIPAFNYYLLHQHKRECRKQGDKCTVCIMRNLAFKCFSTDISFRPDNLVEDLQNIAPYFQRGQEEDAHEFLTCLINKMQEDLMFNVNPKPDLFTEMTTGIGQIFGGFLKKQTICINCKRVSNNFEPLLNISLDINTADNIYTALDQFFKGDDMSGETWYNCEYCKDKQKAFTKYVIDEPPKTLIIHLKRYDYLMNKLDHDVTYGKRLNITPYTSDDFNEEAMYDLCGVVVHLGNFTSGHYYANVVDPKSLRNLKKGWNQMNDHSVSEEEWKDVLDDQAYLLFYVRSDCKLDCAKSQTTYPSLKKRNLEEYKLLLNLSADESNIPVDDAKLRIDQNCTPPLLVDSVTPPKEVVPNSPTEKPDKNEHRDNFSNSECLENVSERDDKIDDTKSSESQNLAHLPIVLVEKEEEFNVEQIIPENRKRKCNFLSEYEPQLKKFGSSRF